MNNDLETIYDRDIQPLVERITLVAKQTDMPMFMTFQDGPDSFRTSFVNGKHSTFHKLQMHYWLHQTWSFDDFMKKVIQDARENGHDSLYLKAMGIAHRPDGPRRFPRRSSVE